jgi:acyl-CoA thioesterase I
MSAAFLRVSSLGYGVIRSIRNLALVFLTAGAAAAEPQTLVALGGSLTQGYGLSVEEGFVPQLQVWLTGQGADVTVINAGVSGDTTAGGLARVGWTLGGGDVDALIVALGGNDFLRGLDPVASRENLSGILEAAAAGGVKVLLVGIAVADNYGPDYRAAFEAMYPELAAEYGVALFSDFFEGLTTAAGISEARAAYMQPDGLHPNADGVRRIVEAMGPAVLALMHEE